MTIQRPSKERIILRVDAMNPTVKDLSNSENKFFDLEGRLYVGGVLRSMYNSLPPKVSSRNGYRGCMASVDYNGYKPNLVKNSLSLNDVVESCGGQSSGEMSKCRVDSCHNGGECRPRWRSYTCDCDMTSYTGHTCNQPSTYATFGPGPGMIMYRFPDSNVRDTNEDYLAFGFRTDQNNVRPVILFRVESSTGVDYMEVRLVNGVVFMVYNLGTSDIPVANTFQSGHNDGNYHVVRITRNQANATLQVDNKRPVHKSPASLVLNRVPILDLAAKRDPFIRKTGDVVITPARRAPTPGHYSNVKHSSNTIKQTNLHVRFNSEESSFKENSVRFGDPNSPFQKTVPRNTLTEGSGNQIINAQDASELFPNYDYDSDISYDLNSISGESLEGSGRQEINPQEHGKVNLAEVPSTVIDSMNIQWYKKLRQRPLPRKHKAVEEALHHEIEFGTVRRRKPGNSDTDWNDINGKFPKDRGKITASKQGIRLQLVPHSTSEHTTPRQGTTPGIIIAAGSGDGDLDCPDDVDQDCLTSESDNGIIKATLTVIRKSTTTIQPTKSTRYDPCEDNDPTCPNGTADLTHDRHAQNKSEESRKEKTTPDGSAQKTPAQSRTDSPTKPNLALIIGIVAGVVIALIILVIALYKFRSRDEGTYKVDETQNFPYLEGKNKQSNGALLGHSQSSKSGKKKDVTEWYV
ncbi:hypothetical protein FSP39_009553 [Pinctada imbricata]|uniref:Uncharacterized protein n=1 Tax=Pinctada imbricata TaxID=66713 RepID=A0AA88Y5P4_PINIB|nr:hypothetical protein FSP39_009553 [Pinctada imbricata]